MEQITTAPAVADFTPLSEHQAQTPGTFFGSRPVLHLHAISNITAEHTDLQRLTSPVDVYVTSQHLILFSPSASLGFQIPYPTITVTAQDGADVLLELNLSDDDTADEDIEFLQMRITPERIEKHGEEAEEQASAGAGTNGTTSGNDISTALYKAISDCQELNPDPRGEDDEDGEGGFDETAPGATGWITSENMADFVDEDGNFRMPAGMTVVGGEEEEGAATLGAGAGTTRTATEVDGGGDEEEESKWQRTG
ncbi:hypothetical protein PRZ48_007770 [Zasmidium cellare]|uniref:Regulator of volume decrease after cellular swelling-domain-containing protein n=1 Tax=Zasmidium cellare TaxID=395010 RepID=A0ABR0ELC4_ZASCE|nr:hypothetical protein PRZ48_007770 [Zasmidium cellare]